MILRPASPDDIPLIRELAHRIWWAHYPAIIGEAQVEYMLGKIYAVSSLEQQMAEGQVYRIVEIEGVPIGFAAVTGQGEGRYFLNKFYLEIEKQGKGLGSAVFARLLEEYPELAELRLTVNLRNYKSINFYFKLGFTIEKCVNIPLGEGFVMDDFQMKWESK